MSVSADQSAFVGGAGRGLQECYSQYQAGWCTVVYVGVGHTRNLLQVTLTRIPEYVNFWQGKPLSEREQTVPSHTRKAWKRPKSDYGLHFRPRSGSSKALATVLEGGDDCYGGTDNSDDHTKGQANGSQQGKSSSGWYYVQTYLERRLFTLCIRLFSGGKGSGSHLKRKDGGNGKGEKGTGREGSGNKAGRSVAASMWSQRAQVRTVNMTSQGWSACPMCSHCRGQEGR